MLSIMVERRALEVRDLASALVLLLAGHLPTGSLSTQRYYVKIIMPISGLLGTLHEITDVKEFRIKTSIIQKVKFYSSP